MPFQGVDHFCVDSLFVEEDPTLRQTARRIAAERIPPLVRAGHRDARLPAGWFPDSRPGGWRNGSPERIAGSGFEI
jgi:hypothetical protein